MKKKITLILAVATLALASITVFAVEQTTVSTGDTEIVLPKIEEVQTPERICELGNREACLRDEECLNGEQCLNGPKRDGSGNGMGCGKGRGMGMGRNCGK